MEKRMTLALAFKTTEFDQRKLILNDINKIENITHILISKDFVNNCKDLINDKKYALIRLMNVLNKLFPFDIYVILKIH